MVVGGNIEFGMVFDPTLQLLMGFLLTGRHKRWKRRHFAMMKIPCLCLGRELEFAAQGRTPAGSLASPCSASDPAPPQDLYT